MCEPDKRMICSLSLLGGVEIPSAALPSIVLPTRKTEALLAVSDPARNEHFFAGLRTAGLIE